jgi:hypothetical protein
MDFGAGAERRDSAARFGPYSSKRVTAASRLRPTREQPTRRTRDGQPARQRRLNGKAIEPGADNGAGNRGAPRGARAHKQPDLASDARQRNRRESFPTRSRLPSEPTPKCGLFRVSFGGRFFCGTRLRHFLRRRSLAAAAKIVGTCGNGRGNIVDACGKLRWENRWTLRRLLRRPSLELCGNGRWRVVGFCGKRR